MSFNRPLRLCTAVLALTTTPLLFALPPSAQLPDKAKVLRRTGGKVFSAGANIPLEAKPRAARAPADGTNIAASAPAPGMVPNQNLSSGPVSGLYQIVSGTYQECCGIAGAVRSDLPSDNQSFVRLTIDSQHDLATMTFLRSDAQTVFSIAQCPPGAPVQFNLGQGFIYSNVVTFHIDPGPPPNAVYWNYSVSNSVGRLDIDGVLGTVQQGCADVPTQFMHSNVVAVLVPQPRLRITDFSKTGALLLIEGIAGWTDVIEASSDMVQWIPISTNVMPITVCPACPYVLYTDVTSTNLDRRFYRCYEVP